jgi:hypothetical protein
MIVRRVGPLSCAKVMGMLYALMGLIFGACISLFSFIGSAFSPKELPGGFGILFGVGAIIALPIFYGILGFITSLIGAALYNLVASWVGGVEMDVQ